MAPHTVGARGAVAARLVDVDCPRPQRVATTDEVGVTAEGAAAAGWPAGGRIA